MKRKRVKRKGFPECAGAIDGTDLPILEPSDCPTVCHILKRQHSVVLQISKYSGILAMTVTTVNGTVTKMYVYSGAGGHSYIFGAL